MRIFIAGGGQTAECIAKRLIREGNELVVIEQEAARCQFLEVHLDAQIIQGNAASISTWRRAGISTADMIIAVTPSDVVNLLSGMIANAEAPESVIALQLRTWEYKHWAELLKAKGIRIDRIIHPETDIVARILGVVAVPGVSDIRDFAAGEVKAFGMNVEADNWLAGRTLIELNRAGPPKNSMVAMVFRGAEVLIPHGEEVLQPGDHLYVVTTKNELDATLRFMGIEKQESIHRVFIVGGGELGSSVAAVLEEQRVSVKVFEQDPRECERVSGMLRKGVVICGDGTDQETLLRENVEELDAYLALTKDDDANMIASLLARRLGAKKLVALVNRVPNISLAQRLGINTIVSPRIKTIDAILEFVRKGGVLSVRTLGGEEAEAIELVAPARSKYVGHPLEAIHFPRGVVVVAIIRAKGETLIPRGDSVIEAGDRVVFFTLSGCVPELESEFLAVSK
jgi:trk system potassium uptake protein TrkA